MPKRRRRGAGLRYRRKHNRPGRSIIRRKENGTTIYLPYEMISIQNINQNNNLGNDVNFISRSNVSNANHFISSRRSDDINYCSCSESNREKHSHSFEWRQRVTIAHLYESLFDFMPQSQWKEFKLIYKIRQILQLQRGAYRLIEKVLLDVNKCLSLGIEYDGKRVYSSWQDEKHILPINSHESSIIADSMEDGHGLRAACQIVNEYR